MKKKPKIYCGFTTNGTTVDCQVYTIREIEACYKDHVEFYYPYDCIRRMFHDHARTRMVEDFLASDCDILWFLDSDITPSIQVLDLVALHGDKWDLAGCPYPVFHTLAGSPFPELIYTVYERGPNSGAFRPTRVPSRGTGFVDAIATGCLFIKREVFEKMPAPWFEFRYDAITRDIVEGEDLGFCRKVNDLGYKFFIDYTLPCKHQKNVCLLDINNYALNYGQRCVEGYDQQIRSQIETAIAAAKQKGYEEGLKARPAQKLWVPS